MNITTRVQHLMPIRRYSVYKTISQKATNVFLEKLPLQTRHTNLVVVSIPYRYDNTKLNYSIRDVNKRILEKSSTVSHVAFVDVNLNMTRAEYARDGLHLNIGGKRMLRHKLFELLDVLTPRTSEDGLEENVLRLRGPAASSGSGADGLGEETAQLELNEEDHFLV